MSAALPKVLLLKSEVTYKTDATPTVSANAFLLREDPKFVPVKIKTDERNNAKAAFGHNQVLVAAVNRSIEFSVEIAGGGSPLGVAAAYGPAIKACGMNQVIVATTSVTHSPVTTIVDSATIYFWIGDKKYIMVGARGSMKWEYKAGMIPRMTFTFEGLIPAASDVVDDTTFGGALTLTAWKQPVPVNFANTTAFSLHSFGGVEMYGLDIDLGNQLVFRDLPNAQDILIVDRKPTANITIAEPTLAQKNYFTNMRGAILDVLSLTHGTVAGNIVSHASPKMQIMDLQQGEQDNVRTLQVQCRLLPNAGNDEIVFQYV